MKFATVSAMPGAIANQSPARRPYGPRRSPAALGLVVLAHAGVLLALQSLGVMTAPTPPGALMVSMFPAEAPAARPPTPRTEPTRIAKPAPTVPVNRALAAPPVLAAEHAQAATATDVARADKLAAPVAAPVVAAPAPAGAATAAAAPSAPSAPRLDADYLLNPAPAYPPLSRRAGEQGTVTLHVFVEASGVPGKVEVRSSSGFERLDKAATAAVSRWKFVPARQGAEAVSAWVLVPVVFSLKL